MMFDLEIFYAHNPLRFSSLPLLLLSILFYTYFNFNFESCIYKYKANRKCVLVYQAEIKSSCKFLQQFLDAHIQYSYSYFRVLIIALTFLLSIFISSVSRFTGHAFSYLLKDNKYGFLVK